MPGIRTATLRLTAELIANLSALSGVAYRELGAILTSLVAPNPAPNLSLLVVHGRDFVLYSVESTRFL
jgi:hypothetical protein